MGMRKYKRSIAKARLAEMGVEHINRRMGAFIGNSTNRDKQKTRTGRFWLASTRKKPPVWWRVLYGDLAKMYWNEKRRKERLAFAQKQRYAR